MSVFKASLIALCLLVSAIPARAAQVPDELKDIGITEHLGSQVSINDLSFRDEGGNPVRLSEYFKSGRPVLLTMIYYECPNLCNFLLNGLVKSLREFSWRPGEQFDVIAVSINPREKPELAAKKKAAYIQSYGKPETAHGWHFLTGEESQIRKLASEVGFGYRYDESEKQYAHGAASYVLTPDGKISRYIYGIDFPQKDLRLSMLEASDGKIGTVAERFLLFCYRYDPHTKKYSLYLTRVMQAGCGGTVLVFGAYLTAFWFRQRRRDDTESVRREFEVHVL